MTFRLVRVALLSLALGAPAVAQRTPAPEITNPDDPKFLTPLTRQQGGIRPPEQMALEIRHLDLATTVFPAEKRIESVATLTLGTSARVEEIVLDYTRNSRSAKSSSAGARFRRRDTRTPKAGCGSNYPAHSSPAVPSS